MENQNIIRLSVSEAAKLFGVTSKTIREALRNEELRYVVVQGRYKINFSSLIEWSQKSARRTNRLENYGMGQYVDQWKINNKKFSPNPELVNKETKSKFSKPKDKLTESE